MEIVNLFYELARQHKGLKAMVYGRSHKKGAGTDAYPLLWLDDPLLGSARGQPVGTVLAWTVNVDILGIPATEAQVLSVQSEALVVGLALVERIRETRTETGFSLDSFSFISVSEYYDDNAAGMRFTMGVMQANPLNRCGDYFDPAKQFVKGKPLPDFSVDNPDGCAIFDNGPGLPNFNVTP